MINILANSGDNLWPLIEQSFEGVILVKPHPWRVVYVNQAAAGWFDTSSAEVVGRPIGELFEAASRDEVLAHIEDEACSGNAIAARLSFGGDRAADVRFCRVIINGEPVVGLIVQISPRRQDPVTGLPDRNFLMSRLAELLRGSQPGNQQFAVLFIDVNNFKEVNDRHGHLIGDSVLAEAARRLSQCLPEGGHVVRFGGDEFVVLLERVTGHEAISPLIERIESAVSLPIALPDGNVTLSLSLGVAMSSAEYRTPEELLSAADRAMYASKRGGHEPTN